VQGRPTPWLHIYVTGRFHNSAVGELAGNELSSAKRAPWTPHTDRIYYSRTHGVQHSSMGDPKSYFVGP